MEEQKLDNLLYYGAMGIAAIALLVNCYFQYKNPETYQEKIYSIVQNQRTVGKHLDTEIKK
jgi:hypothetical protein